MQQIKSHKAATLGGTAGSIFPTRHLGTACQGCQVQVGYAAGPADCLLDRAFQQSGACSFLLLLLLPLLLLMLLLLKTVQAL